MANGPPGGDLAAPGWRPRRRRLGARRGSRDDARRPRRWRRRLADLAGDPVDRVDGVTEVEVGDAAGADQRRGLLGDGADHGDLDAVHVAGRVLRQDRGRGALGVDVGAQVGPLGVGAAGDDAVAQVGPAPVELVVAHRGGVEVQRVQHVDGRLVLGDRRGEQRGADVVAGATSTGGVRRGRGAQLLDGAGPLTVLASMRPWKSLMPSRSRVSRCGRRGGVLLRSRVDLGEVVEVVVGVGADRSRVAASEALEGGPGGGGLEHARCCSVAEAMSTEGMCVTGDVAGRRGQADAARRPGTPGPPRRPSRRRSRRPGRARQVRAHGTGGIIWIRKCSPAATVRRGPAEW